MSHEPQPLNSMERPQLLALCLLRGREMSRLEGELAHARAAVADASSEPVDAILSNMIASTRRRSMDALTKLEKVHSELYDMKCRVDLLRENLTKEPKQDGDT